MRLGFATGLILLYLIALCRPISPLIEYYANKDFFATVLCINKDKPEMHCNGKCVLMERLKKVMKEEPESSPLPKIDLKDYPIGLVSPLLSSLSHKYSATALDYSSLYNDSYASIHGKDFFHPPRFS